MKARNILSTPVISVTPDATVQEVAALLLRHRISAVPVIDERAGLVGIVSEGDLLHRTENGTADRPRSWWRRMLASEEDLAAEYIKSHARRVRDVMTRPVVTVDADEPLQAVADRLEKNRVKRLPVLRDGKVVGIVSRADLLCGLANVRPEPLDADRGDDTIIGRRVQRALQAQPWARTAWLNISVDHGRVAFRGAYRSKIERDAARIAAERVPGVSQVDDYRFPMSSLTEAH